MILHNKNDFWTSFKAPAQSSGGKPMAHRSQQTENSKRFAITVTDTERSLY